MPTRVEEEGERARQKSNDARRGASNAIRQTSDVSHSEEVAGTQAKKNTAHFSKFFCEDEKRNRTRKGEKSRERERQVLRRK